MQMVWQTVQPLIGMLPTLGLHCLHSAYTFLRQHLGPRVMLRECPLTISLNMGLLVFQLCEVIFFWHQVLYAETPENPISLMARLI